MPMKGPGVDKTTAGPVLVGAAMELRVPDGIVGLVGDVARRHPDLIACQGHGTTYTYASLMSAVDRLAFWLCTMTEPGATVALYLPRSTTLPVVMLACLRSGRAFLPLDPSAPSLRLAGMLEDAKPALLLIADSRQRDALPEPLRAVPHGALDEALA